MACHKLIKAIETKRPTTIINESGYAMSPLMLPFMGRAMATMAMLAMLVVVIFVLMFVVMFVMVMLVMVMIMLILNVTFYLLNPCCRSGYLLKIKEIGIKDLAKRYIAVITIDNLGFRLNGANDSTDMF